MTGDQRVISAGVEKAHPGVVKSLETVCRGPRGWRTQISAKFRKLFLVPRRERALEGDVQAWAGWVMTPWFGERSLEKIATMIWHGR